MQFRYTLIESLVGDGRGVCLFLMLNPGSFDENRKRHPTRTRCIRFAQRWGYGELRTCNLFALRSPDPRALRASADPIGPDNDRHILDAARQADIVVCAWGNHGAYLGRGREVVAMLIEAGAGGKLHALGFTKRGQPRHPLFRPNDARLEPFASVP